MSGNINARCFEKISCMGNRIVNAILLLSFAVCLTGCFSPSRSTVWKETIEKGDQALAQRHLKTAQETYSQAVTQAEHFKPNDQRLSISLARLADAFFADRQLKQAQQLCQRLIVVEEKRLGTTNSALADSIVKLAEVEQAMKIYDDADLLYQRAIQVVENGDGPSTPILGVYMARRARLYSLRGRDDQAGILYDRALKFIEDAQFSLSFSSELAEERSMFLVESARIRIEFGLLMEKEEKYPEAEVLFLRAKDTLEAKFSKFDLKLVPVLNGLARIYVKLDKTEEAEKYARQSVRIASELMKEDQPMRIEARNILDSILANKEKAGKKED